MDTAVWTTLYNTYVVEIKKYLCSEHDREAVIG